MISPEVIVCRIEEAGDIAVREWKRSGKSVLPSTINYVRRMGQRREMVRLDMGQWERPIAESVAQLGAWMKEQFTTLGMDGMAKDVEVDSKRPSLAVKYAMALAIEILSQNDNDLCVSAALIGDYELDYWRAIAIAKCARDGMKPWKKES